VSEVVLRCPHCGTTQDALGECEACHEAGVRWNCANHNPARWLDSPGCAGCGATRYHGPIVHDPPPSPAGPRVAEPSLIEVPSRTPRTPTRSITPPEGAEGVGTFDPLEIFRRTAAAASAAAAAQELGHEAPRPPVRPAVPRSPIATWAIRLSVALAVLLLLVIVPVWFFAGGAASNFIVGLGQSAGLLGRVPPQTKRGIQAYRAGDLATAERELDEAARTYRGSALAPIYLARIRMESGDSDGAGPYLQDAVTREPNNALANRMLGEYHLTRARRGAGDAASRVYTATELAAAEESFARAMALDPADARARGYHACALAVGGRVDEAKLELSAAGPGPWESCVLDEPSVVR
jgi:hypothetical protein